MKKNLLPVVLLWMLTGVAYCHLIAPQMFEEANARLQKDPQDMEALFIRSHYYLNKGMYPEATNDLEKLVKLVENSQQQADIMMLFTLADLYFKLQKWPEALSLYNKILVAPVSEQYPKSTIVRQAIWQRAAIYSVQSQPKLAWQECAKVIPYLEDSLTALVEAADLAYRADCRQQAIELYTKALLKFPSASAESLLVKALSLLLEAKEIVQAQTLLGQLIEKLPQDPLGYFYRALVARQYLADDKLFAQDMVKAMEAANRIVTVEENVLEGSFWQARIFLSLGQTESALAAIDRAIAADAQHAALYEIRAAIHERLGKLPEQMADLETCRKIAQTMPDDWLQWLVLPLNTGKK